MRSTWARSLGRLLPLPAASISMVSPATVTSPRSGVSSMLMQRSRVDLPEPDEPRMETTSPSRASSEMPFRTSIGPKLLWMSRTLMATGAMDDAGELNALLLR
ncbi:hypothetical protein D9M69_712450 [compost metagenome]